MYSALVLSGKTLRIVHHRPKFHGAGGVSIVSLRWRKALGESRPWTYMLQNVRL